MVIRRKDANLQGTKSNPGSDIQQDLKIEGLYTYPNQYAVVPQGALSIASNCIIDAVGVVESRRGIQHYGDFDTPTSYTLSIYEFIAHLITHTNNHKISVDLANDGHFIAKTGDFFVPDPTDVESRIRFINLNKNLYFTTSNGVYKMATIFDEPRRAGAPPALGGSGKAIAGAGWMPIDVNVAYRIVWSYTDVNTNLIRGAPSDRIIVSNNVVADAVVELTFVIPSSIPTDTQEWTYSIYRSNTSSSLTTSPDDNMQLVGTGIPTPAQLTSKVVVFLDAAPDSVKGETLYTSTEGIAQANYPPPFAHDIALFKGHTFYANTSLTETFFLALISGSNMVDGDTITFTRVGGATFTLTAGAAENIATGTFLNMTTGSPSENIAITAQSIVNVTNLYPANTFINAYYSSSFEETPGKMIFRDRDFNTNPFTVTCSNTGLLFNPPLPASGQTIANTSNDNNQPNAVFFSKLQSPEAVPLTNFYSVGSSSSPITRILSLQDTLFIMKTEGLYKITGNSPSNFTVSPIDVQMRPASVNSAVVLNNQVYVFVDQGVVRISDSGSVALSSTPIQQDLLSLNTVNFPGFKGATYGVAYPPEHKYILFTVKNHEDVISDIAYVYNYITDAWTTWDLSLSASYMRPSNELLYFATGNTEQSEVYVERKTYTIEDYTDLDFPVEITAISAVINPTTPYSVGSTRFLRFEISLATFPNIKVNQTIRQAIGGEDVSAVIISVNELNNTIVIDNDIVTWTTGPATVYNPIANDVKLTPCIGNTPNVVKQFTELSLLVDNIFASNIYVSFTNDVTLVPTEPFIVNNQIPMLGWGNSEWGNVPWGEDGGAALRVRTFIPREICKADWIQPIIASRNAFNKMRISAVSLYFRPLTGRIR